MKKIFTLIAAAIMAVGAYADRQVIYQSEAEEGTPVVWDPAITIENVPEVKAGDKLILTFASKGTTQYPQAKIVTPVGDDWKWNDIVSFGLWDVNEFPTEQELIIVNATANLINSHNQLLIQGEDAHLTKVELEPTTSTEDLSAAIWIGDFEMGSGWNNGFEIAKGLFSSVEVGDEIRIYYTGFSSSSNVWLKFGWTDFPAEISVQRSAEYTSIPVTQEFIDQLNASSGLRVCGSAYTATHVDIVSGQELPTWEEDGKTLPFAEDNSQLIPASEFDGYTLGAKVIFTFEVEGSAGFVGWGIGRYGSSDLVVDWDNEQQANVLKSGVIAGELSVRAEGANVVETTLANLKEALTTGPDAAGHYGLAVQTWNFNDGACKVVNINVEIKELINSTEEVFEAPEDVQPSEDPTMIGINSVSASNGIMYNLAGQRVSDMKGIVVKDGKKFVIK